MRGTISLYDKSDERPSTEYLGAMPECVKADLIQRFTPRVAQILARYPKATHVVLSDGALWNWNLSKSIILGAIWILDFWHATQYLSQAADITFGQRGKVRLG